jgi:hypothetical protein
MFIVHEQDCLHTFEDYFAGATGDLVTTRVAFLTHRENFIKNFSAALGFLLGVIAFLSGLIVTMTWLHFSVPLGLNVELYDPSCNINRGSCGNQEWPPKNERYLMMDIHFEYHEVHRHERIPNSHQDIFHDSYWTSDQLIC